MAVDRESRDLQRVACLNSSDIIVTHSPDSVRLMHRSGGWVEHDGDNISQVEVLLFRAYDAIETQITAGDSGLLMGQDLVEHYTGYIPEGRDPEFYKSIVNDVQSRAMLRVDQLRKTVTRRHLSALAARVPVYAQDHRSYPSLTRLPATEFDQVKRWPVIALAEGGAIDLRAEATTGGKNGMLDPTMYGLLHRTHHDRGAIPHDPEVFKRQDPDLELPRRLLEYHYPAEFVQLAAYLLAYPSDDIISILIGESGTGKTTFWQWVGWATGSAEVSDVSLLTSRSQFTPLEAALARSHVVVLDEGDASKSAPIPFGQLNKATAERFDVNVKYGAYHPGVPRLGALVLVGNDWPSFDSTTPGLARRIAWAWDEPLPAKIDKEVYETLAKSSVAHQYMLAVLVSRARDLRTMGVEAARQSLVTERVMEAHQRMMDATTSPLKQALDDLIERGGPSDYVPSKRVREIIQEADIGKVGSQELKRVMAMYGAVSKTQRADGGVERVWSGVREHNRESSRGPAPPPLPPAPLRAKTAGFPCSICGHEGGAQTDDFLCADTAQCNARRTEKIRTGEYV